MDPTEIQPPAGDPILYKRAGGDPGFDPLGRPEVIERGTMRITYTYDAAGRVTQEEFYTIGSPGNNAGKTVRTFDNADRLTSISMYDGADALMIKYVYTWNKDNTVQYRDELQTATQSPPWCRTTFAYDNRKRLSYEKRVEDSATIYEFEYDYDQLGNRLSKVDLLHEVRTDYYYDVDVNGILQADSDERLAIGDLPTPLVYTHEGEYDEPPPTPGPVNSSDNRLLYYIERPIAGEKEDVTREVWYTYYQMGNPAHIVVKDAGDDKFRGLAMYYATNGSLWRVLWDEWEGGVRGPFDEYRNLGSQSGEPKPREFYYNGVGGRYLTRIMQVTGNSTSGFDWDPLLGPSPTIDQFADITGLLPTGDFTADVDYSPSPQLTAGDQFFLTDGLQGRDRVSGGAEYWHSDLVGSTARTTDVAGDFERAVRYTAFGEPIQSNGDVGGQLPSGSSRYGFVGEYGYESDMLVLAGPIGTKPIVLSHIGARWYDPALGRFVQRDPIGLQGGMNVYTYVENAPLQFVDPDGNTSFWPNSGRIRYGPSRVGHTGGQGSRGIYRIAFRLGHGKNTIHIYGARGAACFLGSVGAAAGAGYGAGSLIVYCTPIEDWIGAGLAPIVGPGTGPGIPAPVPSPTPRQPLPPFVCFAAGTTVLSVNGQVPIECIREGDRLLSYDPILECLVTVRVLRTHRAQAKRLIRLDLADGSHLECTEAHPFFVNCADWTSAALLGAGNELCSLGGEGLVERSSMITAPETVYDITVEAPHTYFVGEAMILVHNKPP